MREHATGDGGGQLRGDERGQSEVIGTILLVAIVLVATAGVAQFVFGIDIVRLGPPDVGPQVSFDTQEVGGDLVIEHQSGDALDMDTVTFQVTSDSGATVEDSDLGDDGTWSSGETVRIEGLQPGDQVDVVWTAPESDESTYLLRHEFDG